MEKTTIEIIIDKKEYKIWIEEGVLIAQFGKDVVVTEEIMKNAINDRLEILSERELPLLIDVSIHKYTTGKAKEYTNRPEGQQGIIAFGILARSEIIQIMVNFYMKFILKPPHPAKAFTNKKAALAWLKQFRKE